MSEGQEKLEHTHGQTQDRKHPEMSKATRDVLLRVRKMIPPMLASFHKGMCFLKRLKLACNHQACNELPWCTARNRLLLTGL